MEIDRFDHIVLTVKDIDQTTRFYTEVLGMEQVTFGDNRKALTFGNQKINLHEQNNEFEPKAKFPTCGSADICFISKTDIESVKLEIEQKGINILEGIVQRTGAIGKLRSIYLRDPDGNLIEISSYEESYHDN